MKVQKRKKNVSFQSLMQDRQTDNFVKAKNQGPDAGDEKVKPFEPFSRQTDTYCAYSGAVCSQKGSPKVHRMQNSKRKERYKPL